MENTFKNSLDCFDISIPQILTVCSPLFNSLYLGTKKASSTLPLPVLATGATSRNLSVVVDHQVGLKIKTFLMY